ncbi:hypothetical protein E4U42_001562 [Claviceps africana]|uniref:DUF7624 domain-containing protein n=1 Tax=Claviceps africana TaxID=83212 RepID=A0A8K0J996_9HYPO|nr:hypothetical protein E4U42_001562 [Claviceps africana]
MDAVDTMNAVDQRGPAWTCDDDGLARRRVSGDALRLAGVKQDKPYPNQRAPSATTFDTAIGQSRVFIEAARSSCRRRRPISLALLPVWGFSSSRKLAAKQGFESAILAAPPLLRSSAPAPRFFPPRAQKVRLDLAAWIGPSGNPCAELDKSTIKLLGLHHFSTYCIPDRRRTWLTPYSAGTAAGDLIVARDFMSKPPLSYGMGGFVRSSTDNLHFLFGKQGDMSASPEPKRLRSPFRVVSSPPPATDSAMLRSQSVHRVASLPMNIMSPSDIVGPSPVTSNGTETTEIEDDASDEIAQGHCRDVYLPSEQLLMLTTNLSDTVRQSNTEEAVSVIHAPESFASWVRRLLPQFVFRRHHSQLVDKYICQTSTSWSGRKSPSSERTSPKANQEASTPEHVNEPLQELSVHPPRPPISTDVKPVRYSLESATPRAKDCQDMLSDDGRMRSRSASSLEKIDEQTEAEGEDDDDNDNDDDDDENDEYSGAPFLRPADDQNKTLKKALQNCWTLCKTLAHISEMNPARSVHSSGALDSHANARKMCWKLCQHLYKNYDEDPVSLNVRTNLKLCRKFFQALYDIRPKLDETLDSLFRTNYELTNHLYSALSLYSAQDERNLLDPFTERTLDFYITLCHRMMKLRSESAKEPDHLLSACWSLVWMLFNLRQNRRDGKPLDEQLLGSTVQACYDLSDVFKAGCMQIRPDRNTPRLNQAPFFPPPPQPVVQSGRESRQSNPSSLAPSKRESVKSSHQEERARQSLPVPETPVTEFEDTPISPESRSPQMPNIMVLGTCSDGGRGGRWSSNASNMSSYSRGSNRTSSTAKTTTTTTEDVNIVRLKVLVLVAAMHMGYARDPKADAKTESNSLQEFVQGLRPGCFGSLPSHAALLQHYKNCVLTDSLLAHNHVLPKRLMAQDLAKSVKIMSSSSPRYTFLRDLYKFVFKFTVEEAESCSNVSIMLPDVDRY